MHGSRAPADLAITDEDAPTSVADGIDTSSAMVRAEADHLDATLGALVQRLSAVPGLELSVSPRPGILRKLIGDLPYLNERRRRKTPVQRLVVTLGTSSYWLHANHGSIRCGRERRSAETGQIASDELPFRDWATALFDEIAQRNLVNHDSMVALRRLVEQDRVQ
jgi:hypothetical protein